MSFNLNAPFTLSYDSKLPDILLSNAKWSEKMNNLYPNLFEINGKGQSPHTLFIGCCDSRYNENCLGVVPGEVFTFMNIANSINIEDEQCMSALEFAINVLKVNKIIVCGHTDCGGIKACLNNQVASLAEMGCKHLCNYLRTIQNSIEEHKQSLSKIESLAEKSKLVTKIHLKRQLENLKSIDVVTIALKNRKIEIYGLLYNVNSGILEEVARI